jgi:hypothetical protein
LGVIKLNAAEIGVTAASTVFVKKLIFVIPHILRHLKVIRRVTKAATGL